MKNINEIIDNLPAERRAKVMARMQQLIGDETALRRRAEKPLSSLDAT
jgi:hypothetical protein